ncbi:MAG: HEPN domain-containing protein [Candidatus Anstonellales archaeon]
MNDEAEECLEKGYIRKLSHVPKERIDSEIAEAVNFLSEAKEIIGKTHANKSAFLAAYQSMFHSARALLLLKGYSERSHYCLVIFTKAIFRGSEVYRYLEMLDSYREVRHGASYGGASLSRADAEEIIKDAENFLRVVKACLKK